MSERTPAPDGAPAGSAPTPEAPRVLFATSWYPSHDLPGRAIFVADQAAALTRSGLTVEVVAPEEAGSYGVHGTGGPGATGESHRAAAAAWCDAIRARSRDASPPSWGAPGVLTSRLPVATPRVRGQKVDPRAFAASEAAALLAWADAPGRVRPAIVHAHVGLPDGVAAIALADRLGVPLVTTEHDSTAEARLALPGMREAYLPLLDDGRVLLAVSESLRGRLAGALQVDPGRIGVVPNVVDAGAFASAPGTAGRVPDELLWVGGLKAGKGIDVLLAAFARLHATRPGLRLRLIGRAPSGPEEQRLHAVARDLGVLDAVAFEGQVPRAAVAAAMASAAVFVHPSPYETFGVVAAEALAAGLPVAATPSGGVEEIVGRDGRFGEIAEDQGPEALAAAVARILDDPGRFDPARMRASVIERYGVDAVASQLRARYAEALERHAARPDAARTAPVARTEVASPERAEAAGAAGAADVASPERAEAAEPAEILVCLRRSLAATRIVETPPELARGLLVVTVARPAKAARPDKADKPDADAGPLPDGPRWIELDPDRAYNAARAAIAGRKGSRRLWSRIARRVRHPMRPARLRRLAAERPAITLASLRADIAALVAGIGPDTGVEIVALSADDVDLVLPILDDRVRLSATTLRGLVDRWDAAGRPAVPPAPPGDEAGAYDPGRYWGGLHRRGDLSTVGQSGLSADLNAWLYRALAANLRRFLHRHRVDRPLPATAFDVGTGIGYWVRFWRALGISRVDGCDLVPAAVAAATETAREVGAEGEYVVANLATPGVLDGRRYGIVSCFNVLLHLVEDDAFATALENVAGLVDEGGYLVLAEPILNDASYEKPRDAALASRARPFAAYRDGLVAAGLELVALEAGTVLANNPIEAGSPRMFRAYVRWWRFVVRRDRADARWIGRLVAGLDRMALRTGQAPTTKFALFRRPASPIGRDPGRG